MDHMERGKLIKDARSILNMSVEELARLSLVDANLIREIEGEPLGLVKSVTERYDAELTIQRALLGIFNKRNSWSIF